MKEATAPSERPLRLGTPAPGGCALGRKARVPTSQLLGGAASAQPSELWFPFIKLGEHSAASSNSAALSSEQIVESATSCIVL